MRAPWCVVRLSLFPQDFSLASASDSERAHLEAAIYLSGDGTPGAVSTSSARAADVLQLYEARARCRSTPRSLFAAAALGIEGGDYPTLKDVEIELVPSRELQRLHGTQSPCSDILVLSAWALFDGDGASLQVYNKEDQDYETVRLGLSTTLRDVLLSTRSGTRREWQDALHQAGFEDAPDVDLVTELMQLGILRHHDRPMIWNGYEQSQPMSLSSAIQFTVDRKQNQAGNEGWQVHPKNISEWSTYATFRKPLGVVPSLPDVSRVTTFLTSLAKPPTSFVPQILNELLDGRWLPLVEFEALCAGLEVEALRRRQPEPDPGDIQFMNWVREQGLSKEIDLAGAPSTGRQGHGDVLLLTEWLESGQLVEPIVFGMGAREVLSRYNLPGLAHRLNEWDTRPTVLVAYHGAHSLGDVAEVYAPGSTVLNYCGEGSSLPNCLRMEDLEVSSTGTRLVFRRRDNLEVVRLVCPIPLNEESPKIHPFIRVLLEESRNDLVSIPFFKTALQDFPVRPRLSWQGHIIRRRRAAVPSHLDESSLGDWLMQHGIEGDVGLEGTAGRLRLDPYSDNVGRRLLFKQLRAGKGPVISEYLEPAGVEVDGRIHAAHVLIPVRCDTTPKTSPVRLPTIVPPRQRQELRGPFLSFKIKVLAERIPSILQDLENQGLGEGFFYVIMGGGISQEIRLRMAEGEVGHHQTLVKCLNELLDACAIVGWSCEPYLREWDRYGGAVDISAIEAWFMADSQALLGACSRLGREDPRRADLYTLCVIQTITLTHFTPLEQQKFCWEQVQHLGREFALDSSDRRSLGTSWRQRRSELDALLRGGGDEFLAACLTRRHMLLSRWMAEVGDPERLQRHLRSLIHMSGVRIHLRRNRWEEVKAYFYAYHSLQVLAHHKA